MDSSFSDKTLQECFDEIYYNTKTKRFPDGSTTTCYCNKYVFTDKNKLEEYSEIIEQKLFDNTFENDNILSTETDTEKEQKKVNKTNKQNKTGEARSDSLKRAKDKVFDICRLNQFSYFITITFNGSEFDSKDPQFVMKKVRNWLQNLVKRKGLKYILIPEYHKKGGIHCHALVNDVLDMVDSGTRLVQGYNKPVKLDTVDKRGLTVRNVVYNIADWKYGFSTAIKLDGNSAFYYYITKYVTKDNKMIFGNYYWSGGGVVREPEIIYSNTDFYSVNSHSYGCYSKYKYQSNTFIIPDFDKLADKFDDISSFLDYIYSDDYKREYADYADK